MGWTKNSMDAEDDDVWYDDDQLCRDCPRCQRHYDEIDYEYQSCSKCGWDEENKKYNKPSKPTQQDYLSGDADILTGRWI